MICGNDPNARITPEDQAWLDWFAKWLEWKMSQEGEEPADPAGKKSSEYPS